MDFFRVKTPFCGRGDLRSAAVAAGYVYLVSIVHSILDYAAVHAQIVTRTRAFVGQCSLQ